MQGRERGSHGKWWGGCGLWRVKGRWFKKAQIYYLTALEITGLK